MIYYDRTDFSTGIDVNKASKAKECDICLYWYFLNKEFKFQWSVCNRYHGLLMTSIKFSDTSTLLLLYISSISKSETINLMQNIDLTEKMLNIIKHKNLLAHIKMGNI